MQPELTTVDAPPTFEEWCVVELFGRQKFAGRVTEARFPAGHLQLDIPATDGHGPVTQIINPSALYRMTPTTEAIARAVAAQCRPAPVQRWELPAAPEASRADGLDDDPDGDDDWSESTGVPSGWVAD